MTEKDIIEKIENIEKKLSDVKKITKLATIVSIIVGGGGVFGVVQYFLNYNDQKALSSIEIFTKENEQLKSDIKFLDENGKEEDAKLLLNEYSVRLKQFYKPQTVEKPVEITIQTDPNPNQTKNKQKLLSELPNEKIEMFIGKINNNGNVDYNLDIQVLQKNELYRVIYDYSRFKIEQKYNASNDSSKYIKYKYGVGMRITLNLKVIKEPISRISLNNLTEIGNQSEKGNITGAITLQTIGITGKNIAEMMPLPSNISLDTIKESIEYISKVKEALYDDNTSISPQLLSLSGPIELINERY